VAGGQYLEIDVTDAMELVKDLRRALTPKEVELLEMRAIKRTAQRVKTIVGKEVPKDYEVKTRQVTSHIGGPRISLAGGGVNCVIPIDGSRLSIGGTYRASGGRRGWNTKRPYRVKARIVKGETSGLPMRMKHQGGQPPFRNLSFSTAAFTRKGKRRLPIAPVVGLAVPQMPMNRSKDDIQAEIVEHLKKRLEHEHNFMMSRLR